MSLQQNINNSIFSLAHMKFMKGVTENVLTKPNDPMMKDPRYAAFIKDMNMSDEEFNEEMNWRVNSDKKMRDEVSQFSKEVDIKPKLAQQKAKDAISAKQMEYQFSRDEIPGRRRMNPMM